MAYKLPQMIHPSYLLNPGDMFSITPKWVMQATGAKKLYLGDQEALDEMVAKADKIIEDVKKGHGASVTAEIPAETEEILEDNEGLEEEAEAIELSSENERANRKALLELAKQIKQTIEQKKETLSSKQKQALRQLRTEIPNMVRQREFDDSHLSSVKQRFSAAVDTSLEQEGDTSSTSASEKPSSAPAETASPHNDRQRFEEIEKARKALTTLRLNAEYMLSNRLRFAFKGFNNSYDLRALHVLATKLLSSPDTLTKGFVEAAESRFAAYLGRGGFNLKDVEKGMRADLQPDNWVAPSPYDELPASIFPPSGEDGAGVDKASSETSDNAAIARTPQGPWRPRPLMPAFAFIPRYLEVNQNVCSAVYLRHPVARPGLAEVPTPFPESLSQLAFNWYLRRR
jgi:ribosomal protein S4